MDKLDTNIYNHDSDVEVTHKTNTTELYSWISHLKYIQKELENILSIFNGNQTNKLEDKNMLIKFDEKVKENNNLLNVLNNYLRSRENIIECEDTACDMTFIKEHGTYRKNYHLHLNSYRALKDDFYLYVREKFSKIKE